LRLDVATERMEGWSMAQPMHAGINRYGTSNSALLTWIEPTSPNANTTSPTSRLAVPASSSRNEGVRAPGVKASRAASTSKHIEIAG
jgi:hypothetical protein